MEKEDIQKINDLFKSEDYSGELSFSKIIGNYYGIFKVKDFDSIRIIVDCERKIVEIGCSAEILKVEEAQIFSNIYGHSVFLVRKVKKILGDEYVT